MTLDSLPMPLLAFRALSPVGFSHDCWTPCCRFVPLDWSAQLPLSLFQEFDMCLEFGDVCRTLRCSHVYTGTQALLGVSRALPGARTLRLCG